MNRANPVTGAVGWGGWELRNAIAELDPGVPAPCLSEAPAQFGVKKVLTTPSKRRIKTKLNVELALA
jgi:hypothetical protein